MRHPRTILTALAAAGALLAGCQGGGIGSLGAGADGGFESAVQASVGAYAVLDLADGSVRYATAIPDLATSAAYRTTHLVFRAVEAGSGPRGSSAGQFAAQADEPAGTGTVARYFIGVFEVTQAQWLRLGGGAAWSGLALVATGDDRPAAAISHAQAMAVAAAAGARLRHGLALPTAGQWEHACRAGAATAFSWGDARDEATVGLNAVTAEVLDGVAGARPAGGRRANAFGLHDLHGNVWELTADGGLRGGSWRDTLAQARSANLGPVLDTATGHPLVGLRLVLTP